MTAWLETPSGNLLNLEMFVGIYIPNLYPNQVRGKTVDDDHILIYNGEDEDNCKRWFSRLKEKLRAFQCEEFL